MYNNLFVESGSEAALIEIHLMLSRAAKKKISQKILIRVGGDVIVVLRIQNLIQIITIIINE